MLFSQLRCMKVYRAVGIVKDRDCCGLETVNFGKGMAKPSGTFGGWPGGY